MNKKSSNRKAIAIVALMLLSMYIQAQQIHALSIQEAISYANKNNVQVKNALLDYKIQEQTNRNITAQAYPQLTANVNTTYFPNVPVQSFPNFISAATYGVLVHEGVKDGSGNPIVAPKDFGFVSAAFGTKWNASGSINLTQILFDGQVFVGLQARKTALDYATKNAEVTKEMIKTNVYKVYYQLVVSQTQMKLIDANIERAAKLLNDNSQLYKNGFAEKLDIDRAAVQLANMETQKLSTQRSIDNGYLGLKFLLGVPYNDSLVLTDKITEEKIKEGIPLDNNYQYSDRKEYQFLDATNKLNEYNVKRYKYTYLPTLNLNSAFAKQAYRNQFNFLNVGDWFSSWNIGVSLSIPIFDGFARASNVEKARLQLKQTQNQIENLKLSIDNDVQRARNSFTAAILILQSQRKNMDLAEQVYEQSKKKYEAGLGSTIEITTAQTDLVSAQTNFISALYDAVLAKIDFATAVGKLP